jgi:hypothetical protein
MTMPTIIASSGVRWSLSAALWIGLATAAVAAADSDPKEAAIAEPPVRTSLSNHEIRYKVPEKGYAVLRRGPIEAVVVDNRAVDDDVLPAHREGYHGIGSLKHDRQPRNLFVPAVSGLNFEHIHDGTEQPRDLLFEPRRAPMELRQISATIAELYQPATPHWGLESCMRYELLEGGVIEMTFECVPRRDTFKNGYIGLFWASYIHQPDSLDIHFRGSTDGAARREWVRGVTPRHGELSTHRGLDDQREFRHDPNFSLTLVFNFSQHRYVEPWYFGVARGMSLAQMFRKQDRVWFTQSPSGGGSGNPAWDFQWFIPDYEVGRRYQLVMRTAYLPLAATDEPAMQERVRQAIEPIRQELDARGASHSDRSEKHPPGVSSDAWQVIADKFQPPAEWAGKLGDYRPLLKFEEGSLVETGKQWRRRRQELLQYWHKELGSWPAVLDKPRMEVLREETREGLLWRRVRVPIAADQTSEGWLLAPPGPGPFPAVLVVYYEPETSVGNAGPGKEHRDFGLQLARRGFVTLNIGSPGDNAIKPEMGRAVCQPLSYHAYVAANCWQTLANLPEVDAERIGVTGHSYGGKWALFAAALWDKFAAVAASDPGIVFDESRGNVNYWEPWYLGFDPAVEKRKPGIPNQANPRTGAYKRLVEAGRDLHGLHALIAPRPLLVSGGAEDPPARWIPLNHTVAVNKLLGYTDRVGMTNRPKHGPNAESNAALFAFFEHFLGTENRRK